MSILKFAAVGDCIVTRRHRHKQDKSFTDLIDLIRGADVRFSNFEITTPESPVIPSSENGLPNLMAPQWVIDEMVWMGFNLFNLANNHSFDYMHTGFVETIKAFEQRGLAWAGGGMNLGEARSPGYLETNAGRAALIGASCNFSAGSLAADSRPDMPGRPGLNPLRVEHSLTIDDEAMEALRRIDRLLGTAAVTERRKRDGLVLDYIEGSLKFLGHDFFQGDEFGYHQRASEKDMAAICKWIGDARKLADFVVMSLHVHNGKNGDGNNFEMAEFIPEVAHRAIDAGADVFVGHGPHLLRPIEVYKGKPIFYSLGNFFFELEGIRSYPAEMYERYGLGSEHTPSDFLDAREWDKDGNLIGFPKHDHFYHTILPVCEFKDGLLKTMDLHPVSLGRTNPRAQRGEPRLVDASLGRRILEFMHRVSEPYGVGIDIVPDGDRVVGRCTW